MIFSSLLPTAKFFNIEYVAIVHATFLGFTPRFKDEVRNVAEESRQVTGYALETCR